MKREAKMVTVPIFVLSIDIYLKYVIIFLDSITKAGGYNMAIVKTTVKGQIVIPSQLRKKYHISKGTRIKVMDRDGEIVVRPLMTNPVEEAKGVFKEGKSALEALLAGRAEDAKR